ncbi:MAG: hypothetical protein GY698_24035 [Actinomycetia bacterium]|nr:hypothetical protein [Actinomycetes bacterium]
MTPQERGSVSIWVLMWMLCLLFIAGIGLDLWRGITVRHALAEQAQAAASAGANAIDLDTFRQTGDVTVDPALAEALAAENLAAQSQAGLIDSAVVSVDPATQDVTVTLSGTVEFTLVKIFMTDEPPLAVDVTATAAPRIGQP